MNDSELLERAKIGTISDLEVARVANALGSQEAGHDEYTLIHVLGCAGAVRYEALIAEYLECRDDPMLAQIALQTLCLFWGKSRTYRDHVERFALGNAWDEDEDVRLLAITIVGEMLREEFDASLLQLLMRIFSDVRQSEFARQSAYFAIARASGKEWSELPPESRLMDLDKEADPRVIAWATEHLEDVAE